MSSAASAAFSFTLVPRHVLGGPGYIAPSEQVQCWIGAGGMGGGDIATFTKLGANFVAMCDVDDEARRRHVQRLIRRRGDTRIFARCSTRRRATSTPSRVGTPDHIHAVAAMAAIRAGKHVYLSEAADAHALECRELTKAAQAAKVMTSMGNQGHATEGARLTNEWIQAGVIGEVREVHVWSDRAGKLWKQGIGRPTETPPVPATLDWNLWLGPIQERPYHPAYAPVRLARLVGLRHRGARRHGLPHHRSSGVGAEAGGTHVGRSHARPSTER